MLLSWFRSLTTRRSQSVRPTRSEVRRWEQGSSRPWLEALEDRTLLNAADLSITLAGTPAALVPGALLTYTLSVMNNGPQDTSASPTVTDMLSAGLQFIAASSNRGTVAFAGNIVTATPGILANGASATITIQATPTGGTTLSNTASVAVGTGDTDANSFNNNTTIQTMVKPIPNTAADLQVTATSSSASVVPGQALTYTLTVTNLSTANAAASTTLTGSLPARFLFIAATSNQGTVTQSGGTFTATLDTVTNGKPATVTILGTPAAAGTLDSSVVATTLVGDSSLANNSNSVSTTVGTVPSTAADLQVAFTTAPTTAVIGQNVSYAATVTNLSAANAASNTTLTAVLPTGLTFVSATLSAGTVTQAGGVVTVSLGTVNNGTPVAVTLTARASVPGPVNLTSVATTSAGDLSLANNLATAATSVNQVATTTVLTIFSPTTLNPGQEVTLTATVSATGSGTPTGTVTFRDGTASLGTAALSGAGVAAFAVTQGLTVGRHSLSAVYGGDTNFSTSTSATVTQTVKAATTTALVASPNPSTMGLTVTFTATVTGPGAATGRPTGNVAVMSGTQTLGTVALNASGVATFSTAALAAGTTSVTAVYAGDTNFAGSTSTAVTQTVNTLGQGNQCYVTQLYSDLLSRLPDPAGLQTWVSALNGNQLTRTQVAQAFENSTEYRNRTLDQFYAQLLRRVVDPTGRNTWLDFLNKGGTFEQVEGGILGSLEYFQTRGGSAVNGFLDAVYSDVLGRAVDGGGRTTFTTALAQGLDRVGAARVILTSVESDTREVKRYYNQFLRRDPESGGATTFLNALQAGLSNEKAIAAILASEEYFSKFCTM